MVDSIFSVGDTVQLVGSGWERYCSTPLLNKLRKVIEVDEYGVAAVIVVQHGSEGYYGWVHPDKSHELFGVVVTPSG